MTTQLTRRPMDVGKALTAGGQASYLPSAARTTAQTGDSVETTGYAGLRAVVDITAYSGTGSLTLTIQGYDPVSGKWYTLLASAALAATGTTDLVVYPGCVAVANRVANVPLPRDVRTTVAVGDASSQTYSVGLQLLP